MSAFETNLKRLRTRRNMKQEELAQLMNVTRQTISGWETGRRQPDLDSLQKLAEVLEVDVHKLIYGSKPGEYPKYQRKYVILAAVFGSIVAIIQLFRLFVWPYFRVICNTNHWGLAITICYAIMRQGCSFASGALIPAMIRLFVPVRLDKKRQVSCLIGGMLLLLPLVLLWLGVGFWIRWTVYPFGNAFLSYILPFASGLCIALGIAHKSNE